MTIPVLSLSKPKRMRGAMGAGGIAVQDPDSTSQVAPSFSNCPSAPRPPQTMIWLRHGEYTVAASRRGATGRSGSWVHLPAHAGRASDADGAAATPSAGAVAAAGHVINGPGSVTPSDAGPSEGPVPGDAAPCDAQGGVAPVPAATGGGEMMFRAPRWVLPGTWRSPAQSRHQAPPSAR
jgi:hypothetical protein